MQNEHYGLIYCYEFLAIDGKNKMWMNCANKLGLPKKPLMNCFNRGNGTEVIFYFNYLLRFTYLFILFLANKCESN
jgi:interferon gamma-inducible protein 30